jgi:hypothetical protein
MSHHFQMLGVHTGPVSAEVIQNKSLWDRLHQSFVSESVSSNPQTADPKAAVATINPARPHPAAIGQLRYLAPESVFQHSKSHAVTLAVPYDRNPRTPVRWQELVDAMEELEYPVKARLT